MQEKDKLRRMAETEMEKRKEEIWQQKDQDDRTCLQINRRQKQKIEDFEKRYRDHSKRNSRRPGQS